MSNRIAKVYVRNIFAGLLQETDEGYSFKYDENYLKEYDSPVSLTLPLREEEYSSNILFPFFDGLIPEGFLFDEACNNWKINQKDRFGILLLTSKDTIGDVTLEGINL